MINCYKFVLLVCFIFTVHASGELIEYYPGQAADPLSRCVSFRDIIQTRSQAELELSQCVTTGQLLSVLAYYEDAFSMLAEDGQGGITQQGKYATFLSTSYFNYQYDIYAKIIKKHKSGKKLLTAAQALEIGCFYESHGISGYHQFFVYARDYHTES